MTCYFCHATQSVDGTHNNPLVLATDDTLFGPFADPAPDTPHKAKYSRLLDDDAAVRRRVRQLPRHPESAGRARRTNV